MLNCVHLLPMSDAINCLFRIIFENRVYFMSRGQAKHRFAKKSFFEGDATVA